MDQKGAAARLNDTMRAQICLLFVYAVFKRKGSINSFVINREHFVSVSIPHDNDIVAALDELRNLTDGNVRAWLEKGRGNTMDQIYVRINDPDKLHARYLEHMGLAGRLDFTYKKDTNTFLLGDIPLEINTDSVKEKAILALVFNTADNECYLDEVYEHHAFSDIDDPTKRRKSVKDTIRRINKKVEVATRIDKPLLKLERDRLYKTSD